jgi:hypothetical protein
VGKSDRKNRLQDPVVDERIFKWVLRKQNGRGMECSVSGQNEPLGSRKWGEFLDFLTIH